MKAYLLPFGDLIAYCLMPNHFHWQFYVKEVSIKREMWAAHIDKIEFERRVEKYGSRAKKVEYSKKRLANAKPLITLNESIGFLEKGYAQTINKQQGSTGSLFRSQCKAKDGWEDHVFSIGADYAWRCFYYIHNNPVEANLVINNIDWLFSSARNYAGIINDDLVNVELGRRLLGLETT